VSTRALRPIAAGLLAAGHDVQAALAEVGVAPESLADADARVPHRVAIALWMHALALTGDDCFGLHAAEAIDFTVFDVQAHAMLASPTLREGIERIQRYHRLQHDASVLSLEHEEGGFRLAHRLPGGLNIPRQPGEYIVATLLLGGRLATGTEWQPHAVRFAHAAPADTREHERIFGVRPTFGATDHSLVIPEAIMDLPNVRADEGLRSVLDRHAELLLERLPKTSSLADRVRERVAAELSGGNPAIDVIADGLHMSERTLRRRLEDEGVVFKELVDGLRHQLALRYLGDASLSVSEVAYLLGFSAPSAFHRAFKRWTGKSPRQHRKG
jgi:AraC-like DNA-binding protein